MVTSLREFRRGRSAAAPPSFDGWGNCYQIVDLATNAIRLDRALPVTVPNNANAAQIATVLPFWFNPNAIAVFPTTMFKQADMP